MLLMNGKFGKMLAAVGTMGALMGGVSNVDAAEPPKTEIKAVQQIDNKTYMVARVIYSETSSVASFEEIQLVCSVIKNRINNKAFGNGKLSNAYDVVTQPGAFSCIGDSNNSNWNQFKPDLNINTKNAVSLARGLMKGGWSNMTPDIVYYHDKSIDMPSSWDNRYWKPILVKETKHFKFYKIVAKPVPKKK